jgi:hypothetical protein
MRIMQIINSLMRNFLIGLNCKYLSFISRYTNSKSNNLQKIKEDIEKSKPKLFKPRSKSVGRFNTDPTSYVSNPDKIYDYQRKRKEHVKDIETSMLQVNKISKKRNKE